MKLIVGLGNPEEKYIGTRHNLGFEVLDELSKKLNLVDWRLENKFKSEIIQAPELILAKPQTYMNNSGLAAQLLTAYYKLPTTNLIVIHDELDLPLGHIKIRLGGAGAGHHGVESIIDKLGTDQFVRVRLGIGNLQSQSGEHRKRSFSAEHYVLEPFLPSEHHVVKKMVKQSLQALELIIEEGVEKAQTQFN
ncbi:aminoacyl-tRNA hydrolase [Candidatus Daviesbacteria bacterium]|nr:aminoacyl-tRNA hydrolase [Candidatus Daviesbacteria bacterium]